MESTIATFIIIYIVCLIAWIIRMVKKRKEVFEQVLTRLGFTAVINPDEALLDRIIPMVQQHNEKVSVRKVYKRNEGCGVLYDCHIYRSRERNSESRSSVFVMPGLDLPAFRLAPCMVRSGMFSGLMRKATQMALNQGGFAQVDTSYMPDFSAGYMLAAKDPDKVRVEMPSHLWREIMALSDHLFMKGQGDTVIFSVIDIAAIRKKGSFEGQEEERLAQAVAVASGLGCVFKSALREPAYSVWR
jgi:hypothetical protein